MPPVTFEYSALYYLNQWLLRDRKYCDAFNGSDENVQLEALREAAIFYGVARNLPCKHDSHIGRLKPILDVIASVLPQDFQEPHLIPKVLEVRNALSNAYGGNDLLSLTTKFLWLRLKQPIIIYDGNARRALQATDGDLKDFYSKWRNQFGRNRTAIQNACNLLQGIHRFSIDPVSATPQYISKVASEEWFQERVFDIYLWHEGA